MPTEDIGEKDSPTSFPSIPSSSEDEKEESTDPQPHCPTLAAAASQIAGVVDELRPLAKADLRKQVANRRVQT